MHLTRAHRTVIIILLAILCWTPARGQQLDRSASPAPVAATPPTNKDSFHIYLLMGQSNMAGRDTRTPPSQVENPRVLAFNADSQRGVAQDPIHPKEGRA